MAAPQPVPRQISFEHHENGIGVGISCPRISWTVSASSGVQNWHQREYEVQIDRSTTGRNPSKLFKVASSDSVLVPWPDLPLSSRERASLRIRVNGTADGQSPLGAPSEWSDWVSVEAGLLNRHDWAAGLITSKGHVEKDACIRPVRFRKLFHLDSSLLQSVDRARLYITSHGVYEAYLNGVRLGDHFMAPGWTSYSHRLYYQVLDATPLLNREGANVLSIEVAEGWYAGQLTWVAGKRHLYGNKIGAIAQLELIAADNTVSQTIVSDDSWQYGTSAIVSSEIYDGEVYDTRQEYKDWTTTTTSTGVSAQHEWQPVEVLPLSDAELISPDGPPVRITEVLRPVDIFTTPSGKTIVDFGQNITGKLIIHEICKSSGHQVELKHAEVLEHGELCTRPLRSARATDVVICSDEPLVEWSPKYTFHGFRYVQVEGWSPEDEKSPLTKDSISALVMHSAMSRRGTFECSNAKLNKLHENVVWSMRDNFLSVPTDCPQRDERLGWTGDLQAFCPTSCFLYNTTGMVRDWLEDLTVEQIDAKGVVPLVIPNVLKEPTWPSLPQAVWDDAAILIPWCLYRWSGDVEILKRQYGSMKMHLNVIPRDQDGLWDPEIKQHGDWLDPNAPPADPGLARTDGTLVADAYLVHVLETMVKICDILGHDGDKQQFQAESEKLRTAFQAKYIAPSGLVVGDSQTSLALSLVFGLHDDPAQAAFAARRLAKLVCANKFRISTGFAGTPIILKALTMGGRTDLAYKMLLEESCPSWLYPVTQGSTTIWERWDSMLPDGSVNPGEMTSFNHYALGSVANWLHECIGGLSPIDPAWKTFRVAVRPGGGITSAAVTFESPYGRIESSWTIEKGGDEQTEFHLELVVPLNTVAYIEMPGQEAGDASLELGSGRHQLACQYSSGKD